MADCAHSTVERHFLAIKEDGSLSTSADQLASLFERYAILALRASRTANEVFLALPWQLLASFAIRALCHSCIESVSNSIYYKLASKKYFVCIRSTSSTIHQEAPTTRETQWYIQRSPLPHTERHARSVWVVCYVLPNRSTWTYEHGSYYGCKSTLHIQNNDIQMKTISMCLYISKLDDRR